MKLRPSRTVFSFQIITVFLGFSIGSLQASQVISLSENQRIEVAISADSMNRIAVQNDRISQVFGDEGAFVSQADENTGQLFIKPSSENGTKPLSITFITENGVTQDLILKPTAKSATTTVFNTSVLNSSVVKSASKQGALKENNYLITETLQKTLPFQEQLLLMMRQLVGGQLVEREEKTYTRSSPEGYQIEILKTYQAGPYKAQVFSVQNTTSTPIELLEKSFYRAGDLALSFQNRILLPVGKTQFFVVRRL